MFRGFFYESLLTAMCLNKKINIFLFIIFLLAACSKKEKFEPIGTNLNNVNLSLTDSISIPIDSLTSVQKYLQLVSLDEVEYLISYQPTQSGNTNFHFYLLNTRKKAFTLSFDEVGPNGVGKISPFVSFISFDSILISEQNANRVYLLDSAGKIKNKYDFNNAEPPLKGTIYPMAPYPLELTNGNLYSFQMNSFDSETGKFVRNANPEFTYNLTSQQWSSDIVNYPVYPDFYFNSIEVWKVSRCFGFLKERVYSFAFDNNLYVTDNRTVTSFNIVNGDFKVLNASPPDIQLDDMRSQMKFISESGLYLSLIPDPYRKVYYRIYLRPGDFMDADGKFYMLAERPFTIQVIDDKFRLVGETKFEGREFNPYRILVSRNGLLIEEGNPYDPISEDQFIFKLFKLSANDN